jgi:Protein of unknown function (DUF2442)
MKFHRITRVDVPRYPVLRLTFDDGFAGEVDFSGTIAEGGIMASLRDPVIFAGAKIGDGGRSLGWLDAQGDVVDFCADSLRFKAEEHVVRDRADRYAESKAAAGRGMISATGRRRVTGATARRNPGKIP